jgi:hypothetical protein
MAYATRTKVTTNTTKNQIEAMLNKAGATAFGVMTNAERVQVAFQLAGRNILFRVKRPDTARKEQVLWRALLLTIKAKLESTASGIETLEEAFLGQVVLRSGRTVYEEVQASQTLVEHYKGNDVPLLPRA